MRNMQIGSYLWALIHWNTLFTSVFFLMCVFVYVQVSRFVCPSVCYWVGVPILVFPCFALFHTFIWTMMQKTIIVINQRANFTCLCFLLTMHIQLLTDKLICKQKYRMCIAKEDEREKARKKERCENSISNTSRVSNCLPDIGNFIGNAGTESLPKRIISGNESTCTWAARFCSKLNGDRCALLESS